MKPRGKIHSVDYAGRLVAVERYLTTDESASEIATSIGVSEPTMRRYIRELRESVEHRSANRGEKAQSF